MSSNPLVKFSGQMDESVKRELDAFAESSGQTLTAIYTEMAMLYLRTKRVRPSVIEAAQRVMREDAELLKRLAK